MSLETDLVTRYLADSTLVGFLPGGVYAWRDIEPLGLNADDTAEAFSNGFLRPCLVVKMRSNLPDGGIRSADPDLKSFVTTRQVVEHYLYDDQSNSRDAIESASDRIFSLIQDKGVGGHIFNWINDAGVDLKDPVLGNVHLLRQDYETRGSREGV